MSQQSPPNNAGFDADVIIIGAGPTGLMLANLLGQYGVSTIVVERETTLIDYPRAVNMDDESMRSFQAVGLADAVLPHVTQFQWLRFFAANGRCLASIEPSTTEFGWTRRNAFIQPQIDQVTREGLNRFANVRTDFGFEVSGFSQDRDGVDVTLTGNATERSLRARFMVACDGGKSTVRKALDIDFGGFTENTRWMVIDVRCDPLGIPASNLYCDPRRPYVSISLPHGMRRFEFMMFDHEDDAAMLRPERVEELMRRALPEGTDASAVKIIRSRIYTHNARLADRWRVGRVMIAGDAAHIMPVWQGQGFNSGLRDAFNLAWKLVLVLRGVCSDPLLDTYEQERKDHAKAMIDISVTAGRIFSPTNRAVAKFRDIALRALAYVPPVKRYVTELRFKPMPKFHDGVVVHDPTLGKLSPVGRMFIQPKVTRPDGTVVRLDEVIGNRFAVLSWAADAAPWLDDHARTILNQLDARLITVRPTEQMPAASDLSSQTLLIGDTESILKIWFGRQQRTTLIIRPDRFVAAACFPVDISATIAALAGKLALNNLDAQGVPEERDGTPYADSAQYRETNITALQASQR